MVVPSSLSGMHFGYYDSPSGSGSGVGSSSRDVGASSRDAGQLQQRSFYGDPGEYGVNVHPQSGSSGEDTRLWVHYSASSSTSASSSASTSLSPQSQSESQSHPSSQMTSHPHQQLQNPPSTWNPHPSPSPLDYGFALFHGDESRGLGGLLSPPLPNEGGVYDRQVGVEGEESRRDQQAHPYGEDGDGGEDGMRTE